MKHLNATRITTSSIGALAGFAGMEHGFFEILQANVKTGGLIIDAIGSSQRFWQLGGERAFTIIPNFLITGVLAMLVGLIVIIWVIFFIDRKYGTWILMVLSILMFLVGGGFAPPVLAILAIILATRINKPLKWAEKHLPGKLLIIFACLWPWSLITFLFLCSLALELAVFGYPLTLIFDAQNMFNLITTLGNITFFGMGPVVIITTLAYDINKQPSR